ncbi:MAG: hypothetical protein R3B82_11155 [Sandaracinaceae bacterium]
MADAEVAHEHVELDAARLESGAVGRALRALTAPGCRHIHAHHVGEPLADRGELSLVATGPGERGVTAGDAVGVDPPFGRREVPVGGGTSGMWQP